MTKEFITHEQWLSLEELGFEEPCIAWYNPQSDYKEITTDYYWAFHLSGDWQNFIPAPLKSQVFRWFREKHKINGEVNYLPNVEKYGIITSDMIIKPKDLSKNENFERAVKVTNNYTKYESYEEAENACIDALIRLLKK